MNYLIGKKLFIGFLKMSLFYSTEIKKLSFIIVLICKFSHALEGGQGGHVPKSNIFNINFI